MKPVSFKESLWQDPKTGKWYHNEKQLTQGEIDEFASEAETLKAIPLWRILLVDGKMNAQARLLSARSNDDKKDLVQIRRAQEYIQVIMDFEDLIMRLNLSSSRRKTDRK